MNMDSRKKVRRLAIALSSLCFLSSFSGCTALTRPIDGIPAKRLPPEFFDGEKNQLIPIDISLLGQEEPRNYTLGPGDILGIAVDKILPFSKQDEVQQLPPVHFPDAQSTLPPSTGFPTTVLEDGTISLPLIKPINVEGLTLDQARDKIRQSYVDGDIAQRDQELTPIVTLMKKRQTFVTVIRQDGMGSNQQRNNLGLQGVQAGQTGRLGVDYSASGSIVKLDAFQNDVLHALMESGGLPGVAAKNEVKILRSKTADKKARMEFMRQYSDLVASYKCDQCNCPPPMPPDPTVLRIPLRFPPGQFPNISQKDVILEDGDIVLIETRDTEFFYTGGLLPGGQHPLPRDYDLDALGAMAMAGYGLQGTSQGNLGLAGIGAAQVIPPGRLYILRPTCKGQVAIEVDLAKAMNDPRQRPIVKAGDTLILQYKPCEETINFGVGAFFTYGLRELFR